LEILRYLWKLLKSEILPILSLSGVFSCRSIIYWTRTQEATLIYLPAARELSVYLRASKVQLPKDFDLWGAGLLGYKPAEWHVSWLAEIAGLPTHANWSCWTDWVGRLRLIQFRLLNPPWLTLRAKLKDGRVGWWLGVEVVHWWGFRTPHLYAPQHFKYSSLLLNYAPTHVNISCYTSLCVCAK